MSNREDHVANLELDRELLRLVSRLVRADDLATLAVRRAMLTALDDLDMDEDDRSVVREWLDDAAAGLF